MTSSLAILTVAGGRGSRAGDGLPKQYRAVAGKSVLARTLQSMHEAAPEAALAAVIHPDDAGLYERCVDELTEAGKSKAPRAYLRRSHAAGQRPQRIGGFRRPLSETRDRVDPGRRATVRERGSCAARNRGGGGSRRRSSGLAD